MRVAAKVVSLEVETGQMVRVAVEVVRVEVVRVEVVRVKVVRVEVVRVEVEVVTVEVADVEVVRVEVVRVAVMEEVDEEVGVGGKGMNCQCWSHSQRRLM